jgi:hypothetical protein
VRAPEVRVEAPRVNANFNAGIGGGFKESASFNMRAPEVRIEAPRVQANYNVRQPEYNLNVNENIGFNGGLNI